MQNIKTRCPKLAFAIGSLEGTPGQELSPGSPRPVERREGQFGVCLFIQHTTTEKLLCQILSALKDTNMIEMGLLTSKMGSCH